jgi:hypothetical protein
MSPNQTWSGSQTSRIQFIPNNAQPLHNKHNILVTHTKTSATRSLLQQQLTICPKGNLHPAQWHRPRNSVLHVDRSISISPSQTWSESQTSEAPIQNQHNPQPFQQITPIHNPRLLVTHTKTNITRAAPFQQLTTCIKPKSTPPAIQFDMWTAQSWSESQTNRTLNHN